MSRTAPSLDPLSKGWSTRHFGEAERTVARLAKNLGRSASDLSVLAPSVLSFKLDLDHLHLNGFGTDQPCVLLGGPREIDPVHLNELRRGAGDRILMVLCGTEATHESPAANRRMEELVLGPEELSDLLSAHKATQVLRPHLWRQIGRPRLNPYTTQRPAEGRMFFGRRTEIHALMEHPHRHYAIAGPGLIGKTSIVRRYKAELIRRRSPRLGRCFYVSFYDCPSTSEEHVVGHIAHETGGRVNGQFERLRATLIDMHKAEGAPIELLLDEVDEIVESEVFGKICGLARDNVIRLVLCGRLRLLRFTMAAESTLGSRLELMRPEPLEYEDTVLALRRPLQDLGISLSRSCEGQICNMTGRLPYLVQFYAMQLVDHSVHRGTTRIGLGELSAIEDGYDFIQALLRPLWALKDPTARDVARIIIRSSQTEFTFEDIRRLTEGLDYPAVLDLCHQLVMEGVLIWHGNRHFRLANQALRKMAKTGAAMGLL